jgi:hypothetical protein
MQVLDCYFNVSILFFLNFKLYIGCLIDAFSFYFISFASVYIFVAISFVAISVAVAISDTKLY